MDKSIVSPFFGLTVYIRNAVLCIGVTTVSQNVATLGMHCY